MAELLLELFSEEIPARMQARAAEDLRRLVTDKLKAAGLTFTSAKFFVTPRRLALVVDGLPLAQPDVKDEKKGPRVGSPQQAVDGFLKSTGVASLDQCEKRDTGKGEFYFAVIEKKGVATSRALQEIMLQLFWEFGWPKSMRWSNNDYRWVRPLHSILAIFDGAVVPFHFKLKSSGTQFDPRSESHDTPSEELIAKLNILVATDTTIGHRFLSSGEITVSSFADYQAKLKAAKVILDQTERRASIKAQADVVAAEHGLTVKPDEGLLDEVTGLVEWPVVLMGRIDDAFMSVPHEVLTTSMRVNQKYFALLDKDGKLAPRFLVTANIEASDGGKAIVHGNERVLRARLSDAKFFWDQDLKTSLGERVGALDTITYHAKLGSVGDKSRRVKALARELAKFIPGCEASLANEAAALAKADLVSGMVGEFPELQGIMGRYYARHEKLPDAVADAIADHYKPLGPNDTCPSAPVSVAVALADKIDTLVGFFAIDEKPTGSKDPFALRRAALGIIRLILENKLRLKLRDVLGFAFSGYSDSLSGLGKNASKAMISDLMDFFADRLKVALKEQGVRHDLISAVFALGGQEDLLLLVERAKALSSFLKTEDGANLLVAYRRANNIVRIETEKDRKTTGTSLSYDGAVDEALFELQEERELATALNEADLWFAAGQIDNDLARSMGALAKLRRPVDAFFDKVTVNSDAAHIRANRLKLLFQISRPMSLVADFSKIEG